MINHEVEFKSYLKGKKPTTDLMWIIRALLVAVVVSVSAWVNWQFGEMRGGAIGGLIALSLDILLFVFGVSSWRGHNIGNKLVDWVLIILLVMVGILCVVGFFSTENKKGAYDFQVNKNEAMTRAISTVSNSMSEKALLDTNYMNSKLLANMKNPERAEDQFFSTLAGFAGLKSADEANFSLSIFIGIVLVIGSVLATTRLNSYYCPLLNKILKKSIDDNNNVLCQERTTHNTATPTRPENTGDTGDSSNGEPLVRPNKNDKFNEMSDWLGGFETGDLIGAKEIKTKANISDSALSKLKNKLVKEDVLLKKEHGSSFRYYKV